MTEIAKRRTKKRKSMDLIIEEIEERLFNKKVSDYSISIEEIANSIVNKEVGKNASSLTRSIMLDEFSELVQKYFREAAKEIGEEYELDHHPVTKVFFDDGEPTPTTEEQAKRYLGMFANGPDRKAHGVRFITDEVQKPDVMHAIYLQQRVNTSKATTTAIKNCVVQAIDSGTITDQSLLKTELPKQKAITND